MQRQEGSLVRRLVRQGGCQLGRALFDSIVWLGLTQQSWKITGGFQIGQCDIIVVKMKIIFTLMSQVVVSSNSRKA